ncbi:MAG TPA: YgjP-like metallopeptidase domain-containing protein, partial [Sphingomicrobium sp.]
MRLRLDEAREMLVLTIPRRMSRRSALQWAERQSTWVDQQLRQLQPAEPLLPGAIIPFEGRDIRLHWDAKLPRSPAIVGDVLQCGGPKESFPARIERFLRRRARQQLSEATAETASKAGVTVRSVS